MKIKNILPVALLFSAGLYFSACLKSEFKYEVKLISGDNQNGFAGQTLAQQIVAEVVNEKGQPEPDLRIDYKRSNGVLISTSTSDALGRGVFDWILDCNEGQQSLHVVFKTRNGYPIDSVIVSANAATATSGWIRSCGLDEFSNGAIPSAAVIKKSPITGFLYLILKNRLYESKDKGRSWQITGSPVNTSSSFFFTTLYDFTPSGKIFAMDGSGSLFSSSDIGQTWKRTAISNFSGSTGFLVINENELMYTGNGLNYSSDQGLSWTNTSLFFYSLYADNQGHILGKDGANSIYSIINQGQQTQYLLNTQFWGDLKDRNVFGYVSYDNGYKLRTISYPFSTSSYVADLSLISSPYYLTSVDIKNGKVLITSQTDHPILGTVGNNLGYSSNGPYGNAYDCIINDDNSVAVLTAYGVYFNPNPW